MPRPANTFPVAADTHLCHASFTASDLLVIHEIAVNEAKRVSDIFGIRLPEFPDVCDHITRLQGISHAAIAALPR